MTPQSQGPTRGPTRHKRRLVGALKLVAAALCVCVLVLTGVIFQFRGIAQREAGQLQLITLQTASTLTERFDTIDQALRQFRPEDVATADRIGLAARMLAINPSFGQDGDIFLFSATAKFVAGSVPLPAGSADVSNQPWFKDAFAAPPAALNVGPCTQDPLGSDHGSVFSRLLMDPRDHGRPAGLVGSFLNDRDLQTLESALDPRTNSITLSLRRADGSPLGCAVAAAPAVPDPDFPDPALPDPARAAQAMTDSPVHAALARLAAVFPGLAVPATLQFDAAVPPTTLRIQARADFLSRLNAADLLILSCWLGVLAIFAVIFVVAGWRLARPARAAFVALPATVEARAPLGLEPPDWVWEIDAAQCLVGVAGNAPQHLIVPHGRRLAEIAGPVPQDDRRWDSVLESIRLRKPFSNLLVPMVIPGRERLLRIYKLDGQPVTDTGGFWGTARLLWEEDLPQRPTTPTPGHSPNH